MYNFIAFTQRSFSFILSLNLYPVFVVCFFFEFHVRSTAVVLKTLEKSRTTLALAVAVPEFAAMVNSRSSTSGSAGIDGGHVFSRQQ